MGLGVVFVATFGPVIFARVETSPLGATGSLDAEPATPVVSGRRGRRGATRKDERVVAFVDDYRRSNGRDPAIADMVAAFPDMPPSTAQRYRKCKGGNVGLVALRRSA